MAAFRTGLLVLAAVAMTAAQAPEPPLSDTRLTVHTLLREDVFAGFLANDMNRFARAERNIGTLLVQRPEERANLLAWKGATELYRVVLAHEAQDATGFHKYFEQARDHFAEARTLTSGNDGVPAIVGGSLAVLGDRLPEDVRAAAWSRAYDSYSTLWKQQGPGIDRMPVHFRGEVLAGMAQAAQRTGRTDEAMQFVDRMLELLKDTPYESTAREWKANPAAAANSSVTCKSCHEGGRLSARLAALNK
jgi:hypothetical protein